MVELKDLNIPDLVNMRKENKKDYDEWMKNLKEVMTDICKLCKEVAEKI